MIEVTQVRKSAIHGRGVFATQPIRAGALIGHYEGERTRRDGRYVLWVQDGDGVIGIKGLNQLRYLNHSAKPNAALWGTELFALRKIEPGTEVTIDYGEEWKQSESCPAPERKRKRSA
jgi:SET domain-containing protein